MGINCPTQSGRRKNEVEKEKRNENQERQDQVDEGHIEMVRRFNERLSMGEKAIASGPAVSTCRSSPAK